MAITYLDKPIKNNPAYVKNLQVADDRYRTFQARGPLGAVLHSVGTPQPSATVFASYFNSSSVEASVHMVLQPDGLCCRLAPDHYRLWHVGGDANNTHMGIEMTEPREISYDPTRGYRLTILNREAALSHVKQVYEKTVELFADLCLTHGWDPLKPNVILSHRECYEKGLGSNHGDPEHLWDALGTGYTMDTFRKAVAANIEKRKQPTTPAPTPEPTPAPTPEPTPDPGINPEPNPEPNPDTGATPDTGTTPDPESNHDEEVKEMRYMTLGDLRKDSKAPYYLPTMEKLMEMGILQGKGGKADDPVIDLSEDAVRILVILDRHGTFS